MGSAGQAIVEEAEGGFAVAVEVEDAVVLAVDVELGVAAEPIADEAEVEPCTIEAEFGRATPDVVAPVGAAAGGGEVDVAP